jgi:class 3 adenylate cyclase
MSAFDPKRTSCRGAKYRNLHTIGPRREPPGVSCSDDVVIFGETSGHNYSPCGHELRMQRRLAAVLNADLVGYSRLMSKDEAGTLQLLKTHEIGVIEPTVAKHNGRIVKRMGDGYLAEFASVVDAVECALSWQCQSPMEGDRPLKFRIGVHLGDIIAEGEDIYGDGVNIASRLEALSQPGCITISDDAFRQVRDRVKAEFHDLGEHEIKNIPRPLRVWEWRCPTAVPSVCRTSSSRRWTSLQSLSCRSVT